MYIQMCGGLFLPSLQYFPVGRICSTGPGYWYLLGGGMVPFCEKMGLLNGSASLILPK